MASTVIESPEIRETPGVTSAQRSAQLIDQVNP